MTTPLFCVEYTGIDRAASELVTGTAYRLPEDIDGTRRDILSSPTGLPTGSFALGAGMMFLHTVKLHRCICCNLAMILQRHTYLSCQ